MYRLEFEINDLPKKTNDFKRQHWIHRWKEAKKWKELVRLVTSGRGPTRPLSRAKLLLIRFSSRSPDSDGLVSGFKHILDGLIESRIIIGDSYKEIGMPEYKWEKAPKGKGKIKVKVEEIE